MVPEPVLEAFGWKDHETAAATSGLINATYFVMADRAPENGEWNPYRETCFLTLYAVWRVFAQENVECVCVCVEPSLLVEPVPGDLLSDILRRKNGTRTGRPAS